MALLYASAASAFAADAVKAVELLSRAQAAFSSGKSKEALDLATKAVEADPANPEAHYVRGRLHDALREHAKAAEDYSAVLKLTPDATGVFMRRGDACYASGRYADAIADYDVFLGRVQGRDAANVHQRRGEAHFKLGHIEESIRDFDRYLEFNPQQAPQHWQRGIALYYAGRYEDGRRQFELHQAVNPNDVENAVWHFLCVARKDGVEKARAALIPIENDRRVPMMQVHALFAGKGTVDDVMAAVRAGGPGPGELKFRQFYAHLYLGLYFEATGGAKAAKEHIAKAANDYKLDHYMWDVARVHMQLLDAKAGR